MTSNEKPFLNKNESGRSLLELLAVFCVMSVLIITGIFAYQSSLSSYDSNIIFEDILAQAEHIRHRGGLSNKSIYDSAVGGKTRSGLRMISGGFESDRKLFTIIVDKVPVKDCLTLKNKKWPSDQVARIRINQKEYDPNNIECDINTDFKLTVVFWSNFASEADKSDETILPRLCSDGCLDCQICENNVCKDICEEGNICTSTEDSPNGVCIVDLGGRQICELDEDLSSGCYCPEERDVSNDTCGDCLSGILDLDTFLCD